MIYLKSLVKVLDNSGAKLVECIKVLRKDPKNCARLGDRMVVVIKRARPPPSNLSASAASQRVKKGDIRHAILVRSKHFTSRPDGSQIRFDENACVLLSKSGDILGTRILGAIAKEVQDKGHMKVAALAPKIV